MLKITPKDLHLMIDADHKTLKVYSGIGTLFATYEAHCYGTNGPGWHVTGGDTPPGDYRIRSVESIPSTDFQRDAFGPYFMALDDISGNETNAGRAGVGIHGGGTGLPGAYTAKRQGWEVTHGCVRLQNEDLRALVKYVQACHHDDGQAYLTVIWKS